MRNFLNKLYDLIDKVGKRNFMLIVFVIFMGVVMGFYYTFSLYTSSEGVSIIDGIKTFKFILGADTTENSVTIASGSSKNIAITVSNSESMNLKYGIYYSSSDDLTDVRLGYSVNSDYPSVGVIDSNEDYLVTVKVYNYSSEAVTINFGLVYGLENGGDLKVDADQYFLDSIGLYRYEVEYLESTGVQYIDTGVAPSHENITVEIEYQYMKNLGTGYDSVIGSRDNSDNSMRFYPTSASGTTTDRHILGNKQYTSTNDYEKHKVLFNDESHNFYLDGNLVGNLSGSFNPHNQPIYLFGLNTEGEFAYQSASRIFYCKIWDNGTLVRDYIPVIDWEGVPCLYDKVNGDLYYNENTSNVDFNTNYAPAELEVARNTQITESYLRSMYSIPEDSIISDISVLDSSGNATSTTLSGYDVYQVLFKLNGRDVRQLIATKPSTAISLTNVLDNAGFENELTNYYNATPSRSTSIKRSGSYSMYYNCNAAQAFLRIKYGDLGIGGKYVYVRYYTRTDNVSLSPGIYVYEMETSADWPNGQNRATVWGGREASYEKWNMKSVLTTPQDTNYNYLVIQYAQSSSTGTGNVYYDDVMAIIVDSNVFEVTPTAAWFDRMVPDFTGTQTFTW